jgi:hypothetical protein
MAAGDAYTSTEFTIKIDEATLKRLQTEYTDLAAEFKKRADYYPWASTGSASIEYPFNLKLGGPAATEPQNLIRAINTIRTNLAERFQLTYGDSDALAGGIKALLADTDAVEDLNGMTADEFGSYVQSSTKSLAPTTGN